MKAVSHLILLCLSLLSLQGLAQGSFTASVSKNPAQVGEYIQYTATLSNLEGSITPPVFEGIRVIQGPSTSTSMRIINGKRSSEYSETWVLLPEKEGTITIGPAIVDMNGRSMKSNSITLRVVKSAQNQDNKGSQGLPTNQNVMIDVELNKRSAFVGEQIIASYKLYSRFPDVRFENIEYPSMGGFWTETVEEDMIEWEPSMTTINGVSYRVAILKRDVLYPQHSGELSIEPVKMDILVRGRSFFDRYQRMAVQSRNVKVNVKPLNGQAQGQNLGTFGQLAMEVSLDRESLPANEAATLRIKFSGKGNLKLLNAPEFKFPSELEVFDPKRDDKISINTSGMTGSRSFEYVIIPRSKGVYEIPPATLSWFDWSSGSFKTLSTPSFRLDVSKGSGDANAYTYNSKTDVSILNTDIRFILTDAQLVTAVDKRLFGSLFYYGLLAIPVLAFAGVWFYRRRNEEMQNNPVLWQQRKAGKVARKHLQSAKSQAGKGNPKLFFGELLKAIHGYLGDKYAIPTSELDERKLREKLSSELDSRLLDSVLVLIKDCEMARFAGLSGSDEQAALNRAEDLINELEKTGK